MAEVILQKLVVEWRYNPSFGFFSQMDKAGASFVERFPHWSRAPQQLVMNDKKKHRQLVLSHSRSHYASDGPIDYSGEVEFAQNVIDEASKKLNINLFARMGIRLWHVAKEESSFESFVERLNSRFLHRSNALEEILDGDVEDIAYVVDVRRRNGWKYNIRVGPMKREQWFEVVRHSADSFETDTDGETFQKFRESLPEQFVFVDVDASKEKVRRHIAVAAISSVCGGMRETAERLVEYCEG